MTGANAKTAVKKLTISQLVPLNIVKLLPSLPRSSLGTLKQPFCNFIANNPFCNRIKFESAIQSLSNAAKAEHLAKRTSHRNRRTRLLLPPHGQQKVREMVGPDFGVLRNRIVRSTTDDGRLV